MRLLAVLMLGAASAASAQVVDSARLGTEPAPVLIDGALRQASLDHLKTSADAGDVSAAYLLWSAFDLGRGTDADPSSAKTWARRLPSTNTPAGQYAYALSRYQADTASRNARGVEVIAADEAITPGERNRIIASLEGLAPQFPKALALLGRIHQEGVWVARDTSKAAGYYLRAASAGVGAGKAGAASLNAFDGVRLADPPLTASLIAGAAASSDPGGTEAACYLLRRDGDGSADDVCRRAADAGSLWAALLVAGDALERRAAVAPAVEATLKRHANASPEAAWMLGRVRLDGASATNPAIAREHLQRAVSGLSGAAKAAATYDLARSYPAGNSERLSSLRQAADGGLAQAALAYAFESYASDPGSARLYATQAARDAAYARRAGELLSYLEQEKK